MPSLRDTIQPFVDRLLRNPGVLMTDEAFVRSFNSLGLPLRVAVMDRVEAVRRQTAQTQQVVRYPWHEASHTVNLGPDPVINGPVGSYSVTHTSFRDIHARVNREYVQEEPSWEQAYEADYQEPPPPVMPYHTDEENARFDRIAEMRRDMAREMERYRESMVRLYQQRPSSLQTRSDFEAWSREVEASVAGIRARWETRIARENGGGVVETPQVGAPQSTGRIVLWPDPADYGPNAGYRSVRGALSAFTRAVNRTCETAEHVFPYTRERLYINGTRDIRIAWAGIPETARRAQLSTPVPPPPPTTTAWVDEPEVDELDIMIKHLPRNRKFMVVVPSTTALVAMKNRLLDDGRPTDTWHVHTVSMLQGESTRIVRNLRIPVFIDPAVFKMHAKREGDWTDEQLDAIIELQGEIPDEETTT